jgi:hypothetical protein
MPHRLNFPLASSAQLLKGFSRGSRAFEQVGGHDRAIIDQNAQGCLQKTLD